MTQAYRSTRLRTCKNLMTFAVLELRARAAIAKSDGLVQNRLDQPIILRLFTGPLTTFDG